MSYIDVANIYLDYILHVDNYSAKKSFVDATKRILSGKTKKKYCRTHRAIDGLSLSIKSGDNIGLIGKNGSGKSTLLRVLSSIYAPTAGKIKVKGRVCSLLNMNIGLSLEATGYENIILLGTLLGLKRQAILCKVDEIGTFTELGDFLNAPVKSYSNGMLLRLTFGTLTALEPNILLLDEVMGVGDDSFMEKANSRLQHFIKKSEILVISSHDMNVIQKFCNKVLVLHKGKSLFLGDVDKGIALYRSMSHVDAVCEAS